MHCTDCKYKNVCIERKRESMLTGCTTGKPSNIITNAERIRRMSNIELAEFLIIYDGISDKYEYIEASDKDYSLNGGCETKEEAVKRQLEWLESEVEV